MIVRNLSSQKPFTTADGSRIRSILDRANAPVKNQSLAEAAVPAGSSTARHHHKASEEFYFILEGGGTMEVDGKLQDVSPGDAILIPPGSWHRITARSDLHFLCCCAPPYSHEDTFLEDCAIQAPMYTRTFSTLGCAEFGPAEVVALARKHQMPSVEFRAMAGSTDLPAVLEKQFGTPSAWAGFLRENGLRACVFGTSFRIIDGSAADRDLMMRYLPWAEAAGVPWLRVFDGGQTGDAGEIARAAETLATWQDEKQKNGWQTELLIETHDALVTSPRLEALFAAAPKAHLLWDSHHTWKKGGEDLATTWRTVAAHTAHIHVKDSISRPSSDGCAYTYVLPGEGEFPMQSLQKLLEASAYTGHMSLEWERLWHPYMPPLDSALVAASTNGWW